MAGHALWYRRFGAPKEVLALEAHEPGPLASGMLRVAMHAAPVNPSDLIPITGAYGHRVHPPLVAGYEGVGTVIAAGSNHHEGWLGRRVLPLRSGGTWASFVDCDAALAVPVPDDIDDTVAARAYINPVAALLMLKGWPVTGRRVLLTAAGSNCAALLAQWALGAGARSVTGICRSRMHEDRLRALDMTVLPDTDLAAIRFEAARADIVFDAVGGSLADAIMAAMPPGSAFVGYGLLSERPVTPGASGPALQRFHVRDHLARLSTDGWHELFDEIWPLLRRTTLPPLRGFALADCQAALAFFRTAGRQEKPLLLMR
jgi:NADPH:quinone reductase-like Zn-dependent oxidoreductase